MAWVLAVASRIYGASEVIKYYGIPWLLVTHWFVRFHVDETVDEQIALLTGS